MEKVREREKKRKMYIYLQQQDSIPLIRLYREFNQIKLEIFQLN